MFSVTIFVVLLEVCVSQGQNNTTVAPTSVSASQTTTPAGPHSSSIFAIFNATPSTPPAKQSQNTTAVAPTSVSASQKTTPVWPPSSSIFVTSSYTTPSTPPTNQTCVKLGVTLDLDWHEDYETKSSERYRNISDTFSSALQKGYNDVAKYKDVNISEVTIKEKDEKVFVEAILCLVLIGDEVVIVVVFRDKVGTGKLWDNLAVMTCTTESQPQGVELTDWKAKEGECEDKCEGAGGPIIIERECTPGEYSCKGREKTKETDDCTTYCSSTVAVTVSSVILAIGIFLSSSFQ